ncbi:MAG: protein O-mannosyl-transferase family [bacterium]
MTAPIISRLRRFASSDALSVLAAALAPLLLYILTMPRDVVLEDDGLFLMVGEHLGIAHPPGYPLYTLIIHAFMRLPGSLGEPALLGHLSSAVLGALACAAVYACARVLQPSRLAALAAAWLFAASEHFWSQAIIAEVYTLNALLFFVVYGLLLHGARAPARRWPWVAAAVAYGLSLANHWPLMGLATPGLLLALAPLWRTPSRAMLLRRVPSLAVCASLAAALPYAWMVWRSQQNPRISFYGVINNWDAFWFYVSRQGYSSVDVSPSAGWDDRFALAQWFGGEVLTQLTLPGFALALLGLWVLLRDGRASVAWSGLVAFAAQSVLLIALLSFDFDFLQVSVFRPYSLVCYGLMALWLAVGLNYGVEHLASRIAGGDARGDGDVDANADADADANVRTDSRNRIRIDVRAGVRVGALALAGLAMTAWSVQAHWRANDRADNDFARVQTDAILAAVPPGAILLVFGDAHTSVIGYQHFVAGRRPDITLYSMQALAYSNRLFKVIGKSGRKEAAFDALLKRARRDGRAVYYTTERDELTDGRVSRHYGFVQEIMPDGTPGTAELRYNADAGAAFRQLLARTYEHPWEQDHRSGMLAHYGRYLGLYALSGNAAALREVQPLINLAEQNFPCLIGMMTTYMSNWEPRHSGQLQRWMALADPLRDQQRLTKSARAQYWYMKGFLYHLLEDRERAIEWFQKSSTLYDHPDNDSINALRKLGAPNG